eukprot:m.81770 g.81770  ORF g.81770 m.81770 type:complete len:1098 (+) comp9426_c0_seq1:297-3590(+)
MDIDGFEAMLKAKLDKGQISQAEYDLILSTHELGEEDREDTYIEVQAEATSEPLTLPDLAGLGNDDQVWLLDQVKGGTMTIGEVIGLAKQGAEVVDAARRTAGKKAAQLKRVEAEERYVVAHHQAPAIYSTIRDATAAGNELARMNKAAETIQAAVLAYMTRLRIKERRAQAAKDKEAAARQAQPTAHRGEAAPPPPPAHPPPAPAHAPPAPQPSGPKAVHQTPGYLLKPVGKDTGFEIVLSRDRRRDGTLEDLGVDISYKKTSRFGRGTSAVVVGVTPGSVADEARLEVGDSITEICSVKLTTLTPDQCKRLMQESRIRVTITKSITAKEQKRVKKVIAQAKKAKAKETGRSKGDNRCEDPKAARLRAVPGRDSPKNRHKAPPPPPAGSASQHVYDDPEGGGGGGGGGIVYTGPDEIYDEPKFAQPADASAVYAAVDRSPRSKQNTPPLPERHSALIADRAVEEVYETPVPEMQRLDPVHGSHNGGSGGSGTGPHDKGDDTPVYEAPAAEGAAGAPLYEPPATGVGAQPLYAPPTDPPDLPEETPGAVYETPSATVPQPLYAPPEADAHAASHPPLYVPPTDGDADDAGGELYVEPVPGGGTESPLYEPPTAGRGGAGTPQLYEAPSHHDNGDEIEVDDDNVYEVPSPSARRAHLSSTGSDQPIYVVQGPGEYTNEPVYETIPADHVPETKNSQQQPTVFVGGMDDLLADEEYEEVSPERGSTGWNVVTVTESVEDNTARTDMVWSVMDLAYDTMPSGCAPDYIFSYDARDSVHGEVVQYQVVTGTEEDGTWVPRDAPAGRKSSVSYTNLEKTQTEASGKLKVSAADERFMGLRAALDGVDGMASSSATRKSAKVATDEYAEYTELSTVGVSLEWYAGALAKGKCEAAVTSSPDGSFLVRESTSGDKFVLCVNDNGTAVNFPIDIVDGKKCSFGSRTFDNLHDLIDHLRGTAVKGLNGRPLWLTEPAPGGTVLVLQVATALVQPPSTGGAPSVGHPSPTRRASSSNEAPIQRRASETSVGSGRRGSDFAAEILGVKLRSVPKDESLYSRIPPAPQKADLFSMLMTKMSARRAALGESTVPTSDSDHRDSFSHVEYM